MGAGRQALHDDDGDDKVRHRGLASGGLSRALGGLSRASV